MEILQIWLAIKFHFMSQQFRYQYLKQLYPIMHMHLVLTKIKNLKKYFMGKLSNNHITVNKITSVIGT